MITTETRPDISITLRELESALPVEPRPTPTLRTIVPLIRKLVLSAVFNGDEVTTSSGPLIELGKVCL